MICSVFLLAVLLNQVQAMVCPGDVFFGEDLNPDLTGKNSVPPILSDGTLDSDMQFDMFTSSLISPTTEDFESFAVDDEVVPIDFGGFGATLTGGKIKKTKFNVDLNAVKGRFAISGEQFYETNDGFTIMFDTAVAAFGFYGVDVGDFAGQVFAVVFFEAGGFCEITIPHTFPDAVSGSVLYFGYIDAANPFTKITFDNTGSGRDQFAFDDFTVSLAEDIKCVYGVPNADGSICCDGGCGVCGGCDCDLNPGGAALCCPGTIASSGLECLLGTDVACICGDYVPAYESECL